MKILPAIACTLALGCAGQTPRPESAAALATPQPDPSCRTTVQESLVRYGLEEIVTTVSLDRHGRAEVVDFLTPDLTPTAKLEFQAAVGSCAWAPVPTDGGVEMFTTRWLRRSAR